MSLNEALHRALLSAAESSIQDEEPLDMRDKIEVVDTVSSSSSTTKIDDQRKAMGRMEEEERRAREAEALLDAAIVLPSDDMVERAKYVPLRLSYEERKYLRMVMAAINVSDYTTCVDVEFKNKAKRQHVELQVKNKWIAKLVS
jgi:hypothetical protein